VASVAPGAAEDENRRISSDWSKDLQAPGIESLHIHQSDYGELPDLGQVNPAHDLLLPLYTITWSWQKVLDSEGAHGMPALEGLHSDYFCWYYTTSNITNCGSP
jgi:hypothetical protein